MNVNNFSKFILCGFAGFAMGCVEESAAAPPSWETTHCELKCPGGTFSYVSGDEEWCQTRDGEKHGRYLRHHTNTTTKAVEGTYWNGKQEGVWLTYFPTGERLDASTFVEGVKHGPSMMWYVTGELTSEGVYNQGKMDGTWDFRWFNPKIKTATMKFCEGVPCKTWTTWGHDGKVVDQIEIERRVKLWPSASL